MDQILLRDKMVLHSDIAAPDRNSRVASAAVAKIALSRTLEFSGTARNCQAVHGNDVPARL